MQNKSPFQLIVSVFLLFAFGFGLYTFYPTISQLVTVMSSGEMTFDLMTILTLCIFVFFLTVHALLLVSAIQIFRSASYGLLRVLLFASIPSFNLFNCLIYSFSFAPILIFSLNLGWSPFNIGFNLDVHTFIVQYLLTFSDEYQSIMRVGVNFVPILFLWAIKKWGKA